MHKKQEGLFFFRNHKQFSKHEVDEMIDGKSHSITVAVNLPS
jgi:hypothetical protein